MNTTVDTKHNNQLRFAIMCNAGELLDWQKKCLDELLSLPNTAIVLWIIKGSESKKANFFIKLISYPYRNFLFRFYDRFYKPKALVNISEGKFLSQAPTLLCKPVRKGKYSEYLSKEDIENLSDYNLDVILRFGFNILRGEILTLPRYGVWSYHHSDARKHRGGPPVFWELFKGDFHTGAILQRLTEKVDAGVILKEGYFKTISHSYQETSNTLHYGSSSWVKQVCIDINNNVAGYLENQPLATDAAMNVFPYNYQTIIFTFQLIMQRIRFHYIDLFRPEKWNIGIISKPIHEVMLSKKEFPVKWLPELKRGQYNADPFVYSSNGSEFILCETYSYKTQKGKISQIAPSEEDHKASLVLETETHLSYPFTLQNENGTYMIPESNQDSSVKLYKLDTSNKKWNFEKSLLQNFPGVDNTLFYYEGKWWLFCTREDDNSNVNLYAFHADKFDGPFTTHNNNPIKTDIRSARPAGNPVLIEGIMYRPSQDCSQTYGGNVVINKILKLNPNEFEEEKVNVLMPYGNSPYSEGLHQLSSFKSITIIDSKKHEFNWPNFKNKVKSKLFKS